ncbi:2-methylcitrate dehydratase [Pseudoroseomonas deserti]|uniref:2-methylcitrate dehydratase n=1 Tax=Teichococcus deserti TaxID=1817963 RepID=A0A1V2H5D2_9PROT|nr:MmgE/PrpD family protein [Pseudoroseomonas deserti]ONG54814.1 2-methylcitrate dehydratase [Pseudoroseomonas deserti]
MNAIDPGAAPLPAQRIADFAATLRHGDIPAAVRARARIQMLDAIGVGLAANAYGFADRALAGIAALGGPGEGTVIGRAERLPLRDAALANGFLMHGLDFDDTHLASIIHATAACLPVALSLGEALDASGEEVLTAYAAGMEVAIRIGLAVKGGFHHAGYHATGVVSHFSSAVTAGRLLGLTTSQIAHAQGIASSTAAGIQVFLEDGAWTKRFHPGWGAVAGITAATLAQHGFVGPARPYEGKFGLFDSHLQAHASEADVSLLDEGLGERWELAESAIKPYPVCHFIHGAADSAIALQAQITDVAAIDSFRILLPGPTMKIVAEPAADKLRPGNDYAAKFSAQFVVATCLRLGRFGLAELEPEALRDPATLALAARARCEVDPDSAFPETFSGGVEILLKDGRRLFHHERVNSGAGARRLDEAGASAKFLGAAGMVLEAAAAQRACEAVLSLEARPVRQTMRLLARA